MMPFMIRRVKGASMHPHLPHGKIVLAFRHKKPQVGDVVIVRHHKVEVLKRVHELKDDAAYLLGDNPIESTDSRHYGWIPLSRVVAVVMGARRNAQADTVTEG